MSPKGRPSQLTPVCQKRILEALRCGSFRETAAEWAGISPETLSRWMSHPGPKYRALQKAVREAEQSRELQAVALVLKAAQHDPNHARWWLERKFPQRWARRSITAIAQVQVVSQTETTVQLVPTPPTDTPTP